jgi:two-component system, NarL family, sensor histidine kinase DegS
MEAGETGTAWHAGAEGSMDAPGAEPFPGTPVRATDGVTTDRAILAAIEAIRSGIEEDLAALAREVDEIDLLARQAAAEAERHEERRARGEERVASLERDPRADATELRDARQQLLTQSRRATLFEAQQQLLEGKHRTLARYRDRLAQLDADLATVRSVTGSSAAGGTSGSLARALVVRAAPPVSDATDPSVLLRAQEELRREIARQMHDGPAQSLANIALQAEIVLRLASRGDGRTHGELGQLRAMVEHALDATKEFIFDVRPMVLDDLGLVPTLRRTAVDRGRRAGVEIDLDSQGTERRLAQDVESGLFRLIDDTINGYLALRPSRVAVRMEWGPQQLSVAVRAAWLRDPKAAAPPPPPPVTHERDDLPPALREMIEQNRAGERQVFTEAHSLAPDLLADLADRARVMGVGLSVSDDGMTVELSVAITG